LLRLADFAAGAHKELGCLAAQHAVEGKLALGCATQLEEQLPRLSAMASTASTRRMRGVRVQVERRQSRS